MGKGHSGSSQTFRMGAGPTLSLPHWVCGCLWPSPLCHCILPNEDSSLLYHPPYSHPPGCMSCLPGTPSLRASERCLTKQHRISGTLLCQSLGSAIPVGPHDTPWTKAVLPPSTPRLRGSLAGLAPADAQHSLTTDLVPPLPCLPPGDLPATPSGDRPNYPSPVGGRGLSL